MSIDVNAHVTDVNAHVTVNNLLTITYGNDSQPNNVNVNVNVKKELTLVNEDVRKKILTYIR